MPKYKLYVPVLADVFVSEFDAEDEIEAWDISQVYDRIPDLCLHCASAFSLSEPDWGKARVEEVEE